MSQGRGDHGRGRYAACCCSTRRWSPAGWAIPTCPGLDLLELFAFVHPARFCVPTPKGLAHALGLDGAGEATPTSLPCCSAPPARCSAACARDDWAEREGAWSRAAIARQAALAVGAGPRARMCASPNGPRSGCSRACPNGRKAPERPQPAQVAIDEFEIEARLERLTGEGAERREGQRAYAREAGAGLRPARQRASAACPAGAGRHRDRQDAGLSRARLAVGGKVAAAPSGSAPITKNLQRQLRSESAPRLAADAAPTARKPVVVRKGRENYLCLLNLEDALQGGFGGRAAVLAQLVARWAAYTQDGDMIGGDLPGWLGTLFRSRGDPQPDRPARRMRLCRLPALPEMLHRTRRAGQRAGRSRHRQPRAGDGQRRARARPCAAPDAHRVRRGAPRVRCRRLAPSPPR